MLHHLSPSHRQAERGTRLSTLEGALNCRRAIEGAGDLGELVGVLGRIYREDVDSGHIRVVSELVAGSVGDDELGPRVSS